MRFFILIMIRFYQRFISPYKGFRCAHNELYRTGSCSEKVSSIVLKSPIGRMRKDIASQFRACKSAHIKLSSEDEDEKDKDKNDAAFCILRECGAIACLSGLN